MCIHHRHACCISAGAMHLGWTLSARWGAAGTNGEFHVPAAGNNGSGVLAQQGRESDYAVQNNRKAQSGGDLMMGNVVRSLELQSAAQPSLVLSQELTKHPAFSEEISHTKPAASRLRQEISDKGAPNSFSGLNDWGIKQHDEAQGTFGAGNPIAASAPFINTIPQPKPQYNTHQVNLQQQLEDQALQNQTSHQALLMALQQNQQLSNNTHTASLLAATQPQYQANYLGRTPNYQNGYQNPQLDLNSITSYGLNPMPYQNLFQPQFQTYAPMPGTHRTSGSQAFDSNSALVAAQQALLNTQPLPMPGASFPVTGNTMPGLHRYHPMAQPAALPPSLQFPFFQDVVATAAQPTSSKRQTPAQTPGNLSSLIQAQQALVNEPLPVPNVPDYSSGHTTARSGLGGYRPPFQSNRPEPGMQTLSYNQQLTHQQLNQPARAEQTLQGFPQQQPQLPNNPDLANLLVMSNAAPAQQWQVPHTEPSLHMNNLDADQNLLSGIWPKTGIPDQDTLREKLISSRPGSRLEAAVEPQRSLHDFTGLGSDNSGSRKQSQADFPRMQVIECLSPNLFVLFPPLNSPLRPSSGRL